MVFTTKNIFLVSKLKQAKAQNCSNKSSKNKAQKCSETVFYKEIIKCHHDLPPPILHMCLVAKERKGTIENLNSVLCENIGVGHNYAWAPS